MIATGDRGVFEMSLKPEFLKVIRFLAVGAFNTLAGYLLFAAFYLGAKFSANLSNALSYLIMISIAFVLYERFVFGAGQKGCICSVPVSHFSAIWPC